MYCTSSHIWCVSDDMNMLSDPLQIKKMQLLISII